MEQRPAWKHIFVLGGVAKTATGDLFWCHTRKHAENGREGYIGDFFSTFSGRGRKRIDIWTAGGHISAGQVHTGGGESRPSLCREIRGGQKMTQTKERGEGRYTVFSDSIFFLFLFGKRGMSICRS